ncbi:MAG: ferritin family protein [Anaerolineae bacterium]|nr:ferritin family protein [Anaerolineae bacterium]
MSSKLGLEEALDIAMNAELKAQAFYAQAAVQVQDPRGRDLLNRLAAFEQYHYQKLSELARSLHDGEGFISYEARTMEDVQPFRGAGEAAGVEVDDLGSEIEILTVAIGNEKTAHEQYRTLAEQTEDPSGQAMFGRLAYEEEMHQRILEDEFYALSNQGAWGWSGMYGE